MTTNPAHAKHRIAIVAATIAAVVLSFAILGIADAGRGAPSLGTAEAQETPAPAPSTTAPEVESSTDEITNVVLILADDLDTALFDQVPRLNALRQRGLSLINHTVTDSLCCPSRVSLFRGQYIHNHKVVSNLQETGGGWPTFRERGEHKDCLPVWLDNAGVTTGYFGKYLNEYPERQGGSHFVPPGWNTWVVPTSRGDSYTGYDYTINANGALIDFGDKPEEFLNDVITNQASMFIESAPDGFFAQVSTFNPHKPAPVAERHKDSHALTIVPRTRSYNAIGTSEPSWLAALPLMDDEQLRGLDELWQQRAQSAESVADTVDAVMASLEKSGHLDDTLVIVTSDNGYHAATHRLPKGKRTAFREDTVVPMVLIGPGITPGSSFTGMTSAIDIAPTVTELLDASAPEWLDGRSLVSVLSGDQPLSDWRTATISEDLGESRPGDPDYQPWSPPLFTALRTPDLLYVAYQTGERELYDIRVDPFEMNNIAATTDPEIIAGLQAQLDALSACAGATCRQADALPIAELQ